MHAYISFKTDYSILKSLIKVDDIINYALEIKSKYIGILDDNPYSIAEFYFKCTKNKIKPVIGMTINIKNYKIYLYIKDFSGYKNIIKIKYLLDNKKLNFNYLKKYSAGLICIIPYDSLILFNKLKDIYEVFLAYKTKEQLNELVKVSKNIIFFNEILTFKKEDLETLKILYKIGEQEYKPDDNYLLIGDSYDYKTIDIFQEKIEFKLDLKDNYIPSFTDDISSSIKLLNTLASSGLKKRLNNKIDSVYVGRLKKELNVINSMGFTDYFLVVYDYVKYAKKNNIYVGPGRGSAAGSLVSYTLGITDIDPIKYDLLFERFLNKDRVTMPDIDIDFEDIKREQMIEYVKEKYGKNKVAQIVTYQTLAPRLVVRDIGRVLNLPLETVDRLSKMINPKLKLKDNIKNPDIKSYIIDNELVPLIKTCIKLEGLKKNTSIHAAGIIISSINLLELVPTMKNDNDLLVGYTMEYLENFGLLKMDFLALNNLTQIHSMIDKIKIDYPNFNLKNIPLDDQKTLDIFRNANTDNIFQFESSGMKKFLKKLHPNSFDDLVSANALFRPGPMDNIDTYVERKNNNGKIDYIHKDLEKVLKPTYGIIVYQEQIMQILSIMAGYSYSQADIVRRAMSKKKKDVLEKEKDKFIKSSIARGYDLKVSSKVYEMILKFANYGFNKSHSVAYALIGYQMAYLKANYTKYFQVNSLNQLSSSKTKLKEVIDEAKKENLNIIGPNINLSKENYYFEDKNIILPLTSIKSITLNVAKKIIDNRPYEDFFDFFYKIYDNGIGKDTIELLIKAGALDDFGYSKSTLLQNVNSAITYTKLCNQLDKDLVDKPEIVEASVNETFPSIDIFGFYLNDHPASLNRKNGMIHFNEIEKYENKYINTVCIIDSIKKINTKKNELMAFVKLSDESGTVEGVIFPKNNSLLNVIEEKKLVNINGKITKRDNQFQLIIDNITLINS